MVHSHSAANCPCCGAHGSQLEACHRLDRRSFLKLGAGAAAIGATGALAGGGPLSLLGVASATSPTALTQNLHWPAPPLVTRAQWGADESRRRSGRIYDSLVQRFVVHHTVTPNHPSDPAAMVRNVYTYHTSREYIDIAYNFLIDEQGNIYEGRWARTYRPGETHNCESHGLQQVRGAHSLYYNDRTIGVALLGTFTSAAPPTAMLNSLVTLLAWKCARWGVDAAGRCRYTDANGVKTYSSTIVGHRNVYATECPGDGVYNQLPSIRQRVAQRVAAGATLYWVAGADGSVANGGHAPGLGDARAAGGTTVGIAARPASDGFWLTTSAGVVHAFGAAAHHHDLAGVHLAAPVVGIAATPTGAGYWLVARDGGIFAFGDAKFFGSMGSHTLASPIVAIAATPSGLGYWMLGADGGVFTFGDAKFAGSAWPLAAGDPAVAIVGTPSGKGYWIVSRRGGLHHFGDAGAFTVAVAGHGGVSGLARTATGNGIGVLCSDGAVVAAGGFPKIRGGVTRLTAPAVGLAGTF